MKKTKNKRLFAEGGVLNSIVGGIGLAGGLYNSIALTTSGYLNYDQAKLGVALDTVNRVNTISGINSIDDLEGTFSAYRNMNTPTLQSSGSTAGGILGAAGSGAATGSAILGPVGGVIGGVIGGIGGAIGSLFGRNKKKKLKRNLLNEVNLSNELAMSSLLNRAGAVDTYNDINILSGYAAMGGLIPSIGSTSLAINYDLTNRRIDNQTLNVLASLKNSSMPSYSGTSTYDLGGYLGDILPLFKNAEFKLGGQLDTPWIGSTHGSDFTNGLVLFNEGGTHGLNPYGGIPLGINPETGEPNLVEEGETKFLEYVFSDRLKPTKDLLTAFNLDTGMSNKTFALISKKLGKESEERPNDPISKRGLDSALERLRSALEIIREELKGGQLFATGGFLGNLESSLRYAPVIGTALGVLGDAVGITNNPNDQLLNMPLNQVEFTPVNANPIGNYLSYNPLDNNYLVNMLNALSGATRSGIRDASGGNRGNYMAGLLAADNNALNAIGLAYRLAQESNINQRMLVETFNRGTNQFNSLLGLLADLANAEGRMSASRSNADIADRRFLVANLIIDRSNAGRAANLTNLFNNLGEVGRERVSREMIMSDPSKYYTIDRNGRISYKGIENLTPAELNLIRSHAEEATASNTSNNSDAAKRQAHLNLMNFYANFRNLTRDNNR